MVLLHEHFQTREGNSKHFSELHGIHSVLLSMEHTWFSLLDVFECLDLSVITANALVLDLTLCLFILDISLGVLLPAVIDLLIYQSVGLFEDFTDIIVGSKLDIHLHTDELSHDTSLGFQCVDLGPVRVLEVIGSEVHPRSLGHQVNKDLDQSLLLKRVTRVLVALHVLKAELELCLLVELLPVEDFFEDGKAIHVWQHVSLVSILHRLNSIDVE